MPSRDALRAETTKLRTQTLDTAEDLVNDHKLELFQHVPDDELREELKKLRSIENRWFTTPKDRSTAAGVLDDLIPSFIAHTIGKPLLIIQADGSIIRVSGFPDLLPVASNKPLLVYRHQDHYQSY